MINKRSGKFYYRNEREIMERLGLSQVSGSGNGWIAKEDGESDDILCQLKSTDAQSIRIRKLDIDKLNYHATVSHKLPVFAVNFLSDNSVYLLVSPESLLEVVEYLDTGKRPESIDESLRIDSMPSKRHRRIIGSASVVRDDLEKQRQEGFRKKGKSAR